MTYRPGQDELRQSIQVFVRRFGLLEQEHTPCGVPLPPSHAHALQVIGQGERIAQHQLAEHLHLDKSTVSRLVESLVQRGWLERAVNPANRREVLLRLSPAGERTLAGLLTAVTAKYAALWARVPQTKRAQVLEALALLTNALEPEGANISPHPQGGVTPVAATRVDA